MPSDDLLIELIQTVINCSPTNGINVESPNNRCDSPFLVHCLAGIGRTGTFIAATSILLSTLDIEHLNLVDIIKQIRKCRPRMIPDIAQFEFLQRFLDNKDRLC